MSVWLSRLAAAPLRRQTWLNLAYVLLAFPTGVAYFIVLVLGISLGAALAVVVVGIGILLATLAAWRAMAALERGLLGVAIALPADRRDVPGVERVRLWLRDPVTWKSLVFVALRFPLGIVSIAATGGLGFVVLHLTNGLAWLWALFARVHAED